MNEVVAGVSGRVPLLVCGERVSEGEGGRSGSGREGGREVRRGGRSDGLGTLELLVLDLSLVGLVELLVDWVRRGS